jgi:hypothetical protein
MGRDIAGYVLGWAIPLFLSWCLTKVPKIKESIAAHPHAWTIAFGCLFAVLISATSVAVYDKFFLPKYLPNDMVVFAPEGGACPYGYASNSTALLPMWKQAPRRFQVPKDINLEVGPIPDKNWPWDHITICLRQSD